MKRCPTCQRTYPDDSPGFCVNDGAQLVNEETQAYDPQKTMLASPPPPAPYSSPPPPQAHPQQPAQQAAQQQVWPPPSPQQQQGQWGAGYYPPPAPAYGTPYTSPTSKGRGLSLATLIIGSVSGLLGALLLAEYLRLLRILDRDSAQAAIIAAVSTGAIALILGVITLISARQRSKPLAIIGMVLSAASIGFYIYLETEYGIFF